MELKLLKMSKQEIFNNAYLGCAAQGWKKSMKANEIGCAYRGANGAKCAIGHSLTDEECSIIGEGDPIAWVLQDFQNDLDLIGFLQCLQGAHDMEKDGASMQERFEKFAEANGLNVPDLKDKK